MKRFLMILLLFVFIVSMTACSSSGEEKNVQKNSYPTPIEEKNEQKTVYPRRRRGSICFEWR